LINALVYNNAGAVQSEVVGLAPAVSL
jgi:hypothetical protein